MAAPPIKLMVGPVLVAAAGTVRSCTKTEGMRSKNVGSALNLITNPGKVAFVFFLKRLYSCSCNKQQEEELLISDNISYYMEHSTKE